MQTARKAIQLLRQFTAVEPSLGVNELARRLGMDRSGVHRLLQALRQERFIEQDAETRLYRLGLGILEVAAVRIAQSGLVATAQPHLDALRDETEETVALLVPDGTEAVCLFVVESRHTVRVGYEIGERVPFHGSAGGQVLMAHLPEPERDAIIARGLKGFTRRTITDGARLAQLLDRIRATGMGWAEDSYIEGVVSAAAPITDPKRRLAGAVTIAAPMSRVSVEALAAFGAAARRAANAIEADWGGLAGRPLSRIV